jgi:hypothetical protein
VKIRDRLTHNERLNSMARSRVLRIWLAASALVAAAATSLGAQVTIGTGGALLALSLVPVVVVLLLWPEPQSVAVVAKRIPGTDPYV